VGETSRCDVFGVPLGEQAKLRLAVLAGQLRASGARVDQACSIPLIVLRLPPVKRWVARQQKAGREWLVYLSVLPLAVLFVLGFSFMVNEEIFKGVDAFTLHPSNE